MRERAELLGGMLEVVSYPGQGTLLRLLFPVAAIPE
jgi:signal transduction histidine kinase